jgi:hypothetical protein
MCMMAKDVSGSVGGGTSTTDAGNPLMGTGQSGAMTVWQQPAMQPYRVQVGSEIIGFASEADFLKARAVLQNMTQGGGGGSLPQLLGGGSAASGGTGTGRFLRTAADGADAIAGFLEGRNLRRRRDDLLDALSRSRDARNRLEALRTAHPDIIPPLLEYIDADRDVTDAAITTIEDTLTAIDIQTGAGVAKVADDLLSDNPQTFGSNAMVAGAVGLGVGALLLGGGTRERGGRRRR